MLAPIEINRSIVTAPSGSLLNVMGPTSSDGRIGSDFNALTYAHRARLVQHASFAEIENELFPKRATKVRALDIGCGDGALTRRGREILGDSSQVIGVDISPDMISLARRKHADLPNLEFRCLDAAQIELLRADLPGTGRNFDIAFSNFALHWLYHLGKLGNVFAGLRAVTVHDGSLLLSIPTEGTFEELFKTIEEFAAVDPWREKFSGRIPVLRVSPTPQQAIDLLESEGFEVKRAAISERFHVLKKEDLALWVQVSIRFAELSRLPELEGKHFCAALAERYRGPTALTSVSGWREPGPDEIVLRNKNLFVIATNR